MNIHVSPATQDNAAVIADILTEATRYKVGHGDMAWGSEPFTPEEVKDFMTNNTVYLATLDSKPVGTFALQWADTRMWGDQPEPAGYLHRMAVKQSAHGKGLGEQMIAAAEQEALKHGRQLLRLDCEANNESLCSYYEKQGFTKVATTEVESGGKPYVAALFEKQLQA